MRADEDDAAAVEEHEAILPALPRAGRAVWAQSPGRAGRVDVVHHGVRDPRDQDVAERDAVDLFELVGWP